MSTRWSRIVPLAITAALLPALVYGSQAVVPNQFSNGDVADANEVNANFTALANAINDNDTRLARVEGTAVLRVPHTAGDDVASGQALRAAVDSIPTDPSIDSYLIRLEPGTYDVGSSFLGIPDGLAICGAGKERTIIHSTAGDAVSLDGGARVEFSHLTLRCRPSGGGRGIRFTVPADLVLRHVRVDVLGTSADGILSFGGSLHMAHTEIVAEGTGGVASPNGLEIGSLSPGSNPTVVTACCCSILAIGAGTPRGILLQRGSIELRDTTVQAPGGEGLRIGTSGVAGEVIKCHGCSVSGTTAMSAQPVGTLIQAACTQVDGNRLGNVTLVHCYDSTFTAIP